MSKIGSAMARERLVIGMALGNRVVCVTALLVGMAVTKEATAQSTGDDSATPVGSTPTGQSQQKTSDSSSYHHDGFFVRTELGLGFGYYVEKFDGNTRNSTVVVGPRVTLRLGGTLLPGLAVGATGSFEFLLQPDQPDEDSSIGIGLIGAGAFASYYPDPTRGLSLSATCSFVFGQALYNEGGGTDVDGLEAGAGVGYDFWVSPQWSIGPQFLISYAATTRRDSDTNKYGLLVPMLAFAGTYH